MKHVVVRFVIANSRAMCQTRSRTCTWGGHIVLAAMQSCGLQRLFQSFVHSDAAKEITGFLLSYF